MRTNWSFKKKKKNHFLESNIILRMPIYNLNMSESGLTNAIDRGERETS